jgi:nucleoside-diphosphate-sugar epimerase
MPDVLITGANGFIGRALCAKMLAEGWNVWGTARSAKSVADLPTGLKIRPIDFIDASTDWSDVLNGIDVIIHLAARVHLMKDTAVNPLASYRQVNVAGTERLARMAAACGVRRFVYISSIKVNGPASELPYTELDDPAPQKPYDISKWEAEQILEKISIEAGLEVVVIRSPLVFGPGVKANFLRLIRFVDRNVPLPLRSIKNKRSLIYIGNLVDSIITCVSHPEAAGETFLVSDGKDISTPDLIDIIAAEMGKRPFIFSCPSSLIKNSGRIIGRGEEIGRLTDSLMVNSSKIRKMLGWTPPYTLEEGIRETVKWYRSL